MKDLGERNILTKFETNWKRSSVCQNVAERLYTRIANAREHRPRCEWWCGAQERPRSAELRDIGNKREGEKERKSVNDVRKV